MTSKKQILANRRNARMSTGPSTQAGKNASRANAFRHGLLSEDIVIPGEDPEKFTCLHRGLEADLAPVGFEETEIVERIAVFLWRLRRLHRVEAAMFAARMGGTQNPTGSCGSAFIHDANNANAFSKLSRYETMMERSLRRLRSDLDRLQKARAEVPDEHAVIIDQENGA